MTIQEDIQRINLVFSSYDLKVTSYVEGVKINQYRIKLPYTADVKKLLKLENNLVIALEEQNVRVYQEVSELVIEKKVSDNILTMNDVVDFVDRSPNLPLILGKDMHNNTIKTDLIKAPHILVSGCTGSGKTQLLHCFIASLLLGGDTTELILIDPKGNEFNIYKDIDTVRFCDDVSDAMTLLLAMVDEMEQRYKYMAQLGVSDVSQTDLTRIVCIIDEFADLIKTNKAIEKPIVKLAQKARACGIHLIIGTQYPKTDVITGLIQANIPTRVCLRVLSNVQSRVAIDRVGGEKLIGYGDMLYLGNGMFEPVRIQAPFVSDADKQAVVEIGKKCFEGCMEKPEEPKKQSVFDKIKSLIH